MIFDQICRSRHEFYFENRLLPRLEVNTICSLPSVRPYPKNLASIFSDNSDKFFELLEIVKMRVRTIFRTIQTSERPFVSLVLTDEMNCFYLNKLRFNRIYNYAMAVWLMWTLCTQCLIDVCVARPLTKQPRAWWESTPPSLLSPPLFLIVLYPFCLDISRSQPPSLNFSSVFILFLTNTLVILLIGRRQSSET